MADVDPDLYQNLMWMHDNDVTDLDFDFTVTYEEFGSMRTEKLKETEDVVTNENKEEYIRLRLNWMRERLQPPIDRFCKGFHSLIQAKEISMFRPSELEFLTAVYLILTLMT